MTVMTDKAALDLGVWALNTILAPDASSDADFAAALDRAEQAAERLAQVRSQMTPTAADEDGTVVEMVDGQEQVVLVAFGVTAPSSEAAQEHLTPRLQNVLGHRVDEWWFAEDDRSDDNDNDSAVFVNQGCQEQATRLLVSKGMSAFHNLQSFA